MAHPYDVAKVRSVMRMPSPLGLRSLARLQPLTGPEPVIPVLMNRCITELNEHEPGLLKNCDGVPLLADDLQPACDLL